jgi:hypothetical protein
MVERDFTVSDAAGGRDRRHGGLCCVWNAGIKSGAFGAPTAQLLTPSLPLRGRSGSTGRWSDNVRTSAEPRNQPRRRFSHPTQAEPFNRKRSAHPTLRLVTTG